MATNKKQAGQSSMQTLKAKCSHPATPASGDPVRMGVRCGVALINENSDGDTVVDISKSQWLLSVKGVDGAGNSAVALYDLLYYVDADTPKLSKKTTGTLFGMALEAVTSGSTATINVISFGL